MDGMQAGYAARAEHERQLASQRGEGRARGDRPPPPRLPPLGRRDFLFLSAVGDYDPLREALGSRDHGAAGEGEGQPPSLRPSAAQRSWPPSCGRPACQAVQLASMWLGLSLRQPKSTRALCTTCWAPRQAAQHSSHTCGVLTPRPTAPAAAADRRWASLSPHGLLAELHSAGRCSALVRVTPNFSDLLMGHSAWWGAILLVWWWWWWWCLGSGWPAPWPVGCCTWLTGLGKRCRCCGVMLPLAAAVTRHAWRLRQRPSALQCTWDVQTILCSRCSRMRRLREQRVLQSAGNSLLYKLGRFNGHHVSRQARSAPSGCGLVVCRFTFGGMVRIYKHYNLQLHHPALRLRRMSFSSYPGGLPLSPALTAARIVPGRLLANPIPRTHSQLHCELALKSAPTKAAPPPALQASCPATTTFTCCRPAWWCCRWGGVLTSGRALEGAAGEWCARTGLAPSLAVSSSPTLPWGRLCLAVLRPVTRQPAKSQASCPAANMPADHQQRVQQDPLLPAQPRGPAPPWPCVDPAARPPTPTPPPPQPSPHTHRTHTRPLITHTASLTPTSLAWPCAQSVLSWQRARIASFLADDGRGWTDVMAQHNSGTGNNQWMVGGGASRQCPLLRLLPSLKRGDCPSCRPAAAGALLQGVCRAARHLPARRACTCSSPCSLGW